MGVCVVSSRLQKWRVNFEEVMEELPIKYHNSYLIQCFLAELGDKYQLQRNEHLLKLGVAGWVVVVNCLRSCFWKLTSMLHPFHLVCRRVFLLRKNARLLQWPFFLQTTILTLIGPLLEKLLKLPRPSPTKANLVQRASFHFLKLF